MSSVYKIQKGDTLWDIAKRVYGDGRMYKKLAVANNLDNPNLIVTGKGLILPDKDFLDNVKVPTRSITNSRNNKVSSNVVSPQPTVTTNVQNTTPNYTINQYSGSASSTRSANSYPTSKVDNRPAWQRVNLPKSNNFDRIIDEKEGALTPSLPEAIVTPSNRKHLDETVAKPTKRRGYTMDRELELVKNKKAKSNIQQALDNAYKSFNSTNSPVLKNHYKGVIKSLEDQLSKKK